MRPGFEGVPGGGTRDLRVRAVPVGEPPEVTREALRQVREILMRQVRAAHEVRRLLEALDGALPPDKAAVARILAETAPPSTAEAVLRRWWRRYGHLAWRTSEEGGEADGPGGDV